MTGSEIEAEVCTYARQRGCRAYKFVSPNHAGVPDRILVAPGGRVLWLEFKGPEEPLRPAQRRELQVLRGLGQRVFVVRDVDYGKGLIDGLR